MKILHLAFPTNRYPCFGFTICGDGSGNTFLPEYCDNDFVTNFNEIVLETLYSYEYKLDYNINIGDERVYAYILNEESFYVGKKSELLNILVGIVGSINDAPFSKLELAEFLDADSEQIGLIKNECYNFLKSIDEGQAMQWAIDNFYLPPDELVQGTLPSRIGSNSFYVTSKHINRLAYLDRISVIRDVNVATRRSIYDLVKIHSEKRVRSSPYTITIRNNEMDRLLSDILVKNISYQLTSKDYEDQTKRLVNLTIELNKSRILQTNELQPVLNSMYYRHLLLEQKTTSQRLAEIISYPLVLISKFFTYISVYRASRIMADNILSLVHLRKN